MSRASLSWSVMKYDLKTGLDILKLPCQVKLADDNFNGDTGEPRYHDDPGCEVQFEKKCCICFVKAQIIELPDVDWFRHKKGDDFVKDHAKLSGTNILIPLEYGGKVRLYDRSGGKEYSTVTELIEDFPRYIKAMDDMICASPGNNKPQIVYKETVLELDRITKNMGTIRGRRETFLICKDNDGNRELAFKYMAAVNFIKVPDTSKCVLKDFIEHLPLPQTIEFLNINPYDVISVDDDDARDLLTMLSGPVQLLGLQMEHFVVGKMVADDISDVGDSVIAIPQLDHVLESLYVRLPCDNRNSNKVRYRSNCSYVDITVADDEFYDCLHQKLYLRYECDETPLLVHVDNTQKTFYDTADPPDTPPIPDKYDASSLTPAVSLPLVNDDQSQYIPKQKLTRKRFFSASDIGISGKNVDVCTSGERRRSVKTYFSQFSIRMKTAASQILFGLDSFSGAVDQDLTDNRIKVLQRRDSKSSTCSTNDSGFTCYLGLDSTKSNYDIKPGTIDTLEKQKTELDTNEETSKSDTSRQDLPQNNDEVVYAKVDKLRKLQHRSKTTEQLHVCPVCCATYTSNSTLS
ncbi:hypothetical protein ACF0H5_004927 [Mactra antiquata]